jgi:hypothetical protein
VLAGEDEAEPRLPSPAASAAAKLHQGWKPNGGDALGAGLARQRGRPARPGCPLNLGRHQEVAHDQSNLW